MRLVDADALKEKAFFHEMDNVSYVEEEDVDKAPTIEERKKGRWEMKPDPYGFFDEIPVCSECGCTTKMRETYNFCPNCGAEMRKGEEE